MLWNLRDTLPEPGRVYEHHEGKRYEVFGFATNESTGRTEVIYREMEPAVEGGERRVFARELDGPHGWLTDIRTPEGYVPRFAPVPPRIEAKPAHPPWCPCLACSHGS